eukprot:CAMPEP_0175149520 /NCGR_PEP_ID=MMETSP0087-20121206/17295_1 /TAXON_ID=136419 /ORGANISM="Unknown Unknown, Strain D1" /LENGTH=287 /DNA_ID=CAMNT_0016435233 /DNA_START=15 /DNA_END=878 /DNA_ORIENTATION=-
MKFVILACLLMCLLEGMPAPFTRVLQVTDPLMSGKDVLIAQTFLSRTSYLNVTVDGYYGKSTAFAVSVFTKTQGLPVTDKVDDTTADALLKLSDDGYSDDGKAPSESGHLYKVHLKVQRNRCLQANATLFGQNGTRLFEFVVRAHGHAETGDHPWPDYTCDEGLNEFTSDGNTPTGLMSFDLNSPEGDARLYGPYPVNRAVAGLQGNAALLLPHIRNGILMHTGEWPGWKPPAQMPNSAGCIHSWPQNIEHVWHLLVAEGVVVRDNPGGVTPYPYKEQGLLSVELIR